MRKKLSVMAGLAGAALLASGAQADFVGLEGVLVTSPITGTSVPSDFGWTTFRVYAAFDGAGVDATGDANQVVAVAGTAGTPMNIPAALEHGLSADNFAPPNPAFFDSFPDLEWDSYLAVGTAASGVGIPVGFLSPPFGDTLLDLAGGVSNLTNGGYGTAGPTAAGLATAAPTSTGFGTLIMQLTFSTPLSGADFGEVTALIQDGLGNQFGGATTLVPAPGAMALLGLAGICGISRRRRRA